MKVEEIEKWLSDVRQEKENGHMITEHDIDAIIELLEQSAREHKVLKRVISLRDELRDKPEGVVRFANEIDRALKGQR